MGFSGYFGLSFGGNKFLLDYFIKLSPWCNVPEECSIKENSLMISDFNGGTNGHLVSKMILKNSIPIWTYLWSVPISIELNCLHYNDLSLWSLVLTFDTQTSLSVFFHLMSSINNCGDLLFCRLPKVLHTL